MSNKLKPMLMTGVTALVIAGAITVASTSHKVSAGDLTEERVKEIVKQYIQDNPKDIVESLQNWQRVEQTQQVQNQQKAVVELKDKIASLDHVGTAGNPKGDVTIVEFFDYNCGACKMMFEGIHSLVEQDKNVQVKFVEYPIFGPQSEENAKIGAAVAFLAPEKYWDFHTGMMRNKGQSNADYAYDVAKNLGIDVAKLKEEAAKQKYVDLMAKDHAMGAQLHIQGTPALIIGETFVGGAIGIEELKEHVDFARGSKGKDKK